MPRPRLPTDARRQRAIRSMAGGSLDGLVESAAPVVSSAGARRAARLGERRSTPGPAPRGPAARVFAGTNAPSLIAIDAADGSTIWTYTNLGGNVFAAAGDDNRNAYLGAIDDTVHRVDADGNRVWAVAVSSRPYSITVERDGGAVYVGLNDGTIRKLDGADGTELWSYSMGGRVNGLANNPHGFVHACSASAIIDKVDRDGNQVWRFSTDDDQGELGVNTDGETVSVNDQGSTAVGYTRKLDPDGNQLWRVLEDGYGGAGAIDEAGNGFAPDPNSTVNKLAAADGSVVWTASLDSQIQSLVADDDSVYAGRATSGGVTKVDADGTVVWNKGLNDNVPAVGWSP